MLPMLGMSIVHTREYLQMSIAMPHCNSMFTVFERLFDAYVVSVYAITGGWLKYYVRFDNKTRNSPIAFPSEH